MDVDVLSTQLLAGRRWRQDEHLVEQVLGVEAVAAADHNGALDLSGQIGQLVVDAGRQCLAEDEVDRTSQDRERDQERDGVDQRQAKPQRHWTVPRLVARLAQAVANAPNRLDEARLAFRFQLLAQPLDMNVDDVGFGEEAVAPDGVVDAIAREDLARVAHEIFEELVFGQRQVDWTFAAHHLVRRGVQAQVGEDERFLMLVSGAAQQRADAGQQLVERERLDEVVVGTGVEAGDAIGDAVAGGQQQDRQARLGRAQTAADLQSVDTGQHDINDDEIGQLAEGFVERLFAGFGEIDLVAGEDQAASHHGENLGVVVDDEHFVGHITPSAYARLNMSSNLHLTVIGASGLVRNITIVQRDAGTRPPIVA